jgi:hypothetical protein
LQFIVDALAAEHSVLPTVILVVNETKIALFVEAEDR